MATALAVEPAQDFVPSQSGPSPQVIERQLTGGDCVVELATADVEAAGRFGDGEQSILLAPRRRFSFHSGGSSPTVG